MQSGQSQSEWDGVINGTLILPAGLIRGGRVLWESGKLSYVGPERRVRRGLRLLDAGGGYIGPGFVAGPALISWMERWRLCSEVVLLICGTVPRQFFQRPRQPGQSSCRK